jgi:predicted nucleotidyltransferase
MDVRRVHGVTDDAPAARLLDACQAHYGDRLWTLAVFGSVGRGTARSDSDLDCLIVADGLPAGRMARVADFEAVESMLPEPTRQRLSPIFKTRPEVEAGSPLFLDMTTDARLLFDREGFFHERLERLRARLESLGATRHWLGSAWYWDLKPSYRPGDVIEL